MPAADVAAALAKCMHEPRNTECQAILKAFGAYAGVRGEYGSLFGKKPTMPVPDKDPFQCIHDDPECEKFFKAFAASYGVRNWTIGGYSFSFGKQPTDTSLFDNKTENPFSKMSPDCKHLLNLLLINDGTMAIHVGWWEYSISQNDLTKLKGKFGGKKNRKTRTKRRSVRQYTYKQ